MPYAARQTPLDEPYARVGPHRYWRSAFAEGLSDELIDRAVDAAAGFSSPQNAMVFFYVHGEAIRIPTSETAFAARRSQWDIDAIAQWDQAIDSDRHIRWIRGVWDRRQRLMEPRGYINHISEDDGPETIGASFGSNYGHLREVKSSIIPQTCFV